MLARVLVNRSLLLPPSNQNLIVRIIGACNVDSKDSLCGSSRCVYGKGSAVEGGPFHLHFDEVGDGVLVAVEGSDDDRIIHLCSDVLDVHIEHGTRPGSSVPECYIESENGPRWLKDLEIEIRCKVLALSCASVECYWHSIPKPIESEFNGTIPTSCFLTLPWLCNYLYGAYDGNFIGKNAPGWLSVLEEMGFSSSHLRSSVKSMTAKRRRVSEGVVAATALSSEAEFSMSLTGIIALCCHMCANSGKFKKVPIAIPTRAPFVQHAETLPDASFYGDSLSA